MTTRTSESGISKALRNGCKVRAFRSGGGLRVLRIENAGDLHGYGEHPSIEGALAHASEDYLAGGRPYNEVYGKEHSQYLTGSSRCTSELDTWVLQGRTFTAWQEGSEVVFVLHGLQEEEHDKTIHTRLAAEGSITWTTKRGVTLEASPYRFPNGEMGSSTRLVARPAGMPEHRAWMWPATRTGRGADFWSAMHSAFSAPFVEDPEKE